MINNSKVLEKYLKDSKRTFQTFNDENENRFSFDLFHAELGLTTELGEINDIIKKYIYYGKPLDRTHIIEELGDLMWYLALLCRIHKETKFTFELNLSHGLPEGYSFKPKVNKLDKEYNFYDLFNYIDNNLYRSKETKDKYKLIILTRCLNYFTNEVIKACRIDSLKYLGNVSYIERDINNLLSCIIFICEFFNVSFKKVLNINIDKLKVRFPEKFSSELALNRNLKAERELLEVMGVEKTDVKLTNGFFKKMKQNNENVTIEMLEKLEKLEKGV